MTPSAAPILALERVVAHDEAGPRGRARGRLAGVDLALGAGVHAILGGPADGALALADVLSGRVKPRRGRVLVAGRDPARSAAIRARIGVLAPSPELPEAASVAAAVELARRARGELAGGGSGAAHPAHEVLEPFGLGRLLARRPASLAFAEARAVELALALTTPDLLLAVLFEPLADAAIADTALVHRRLRDLAAAGACVVVVTSSPADARSLAHRVLVLDRGTLTPLAAGAVDGGLEPELLVLVQDPAATDASPGDDHAPVNAGSPGVRALAAALAGSPAVRGVAWEAARGRGALSTLRVSAVDRDEAALAILDAAVAADVVIAAISSPAPTRRGARLAVIGGPS